jgi:ribosomal protein S25
MAFFSIAKNLALTPYCTTKNIVDKFGVAFTTAQRAIVKLEELGIVSQRSEGKRDRVYCAKAILDILEEPTRIRENLDGILQS